MIKKNLKNLENKLGVRFKNQSLLNRALIHRSYLNETKNKELCSNERLEYLGDAILEFIISEHLFTKFSDYPEGVLTNLRSNLVKTESLAKISQKFAVGEYLMMSRGERESGGQKNPTLLANTFEAILGAIYQDQGLAIVKKFVHRNFTPLLEKIVHQGEFKDCKSLLQERLQAKTKESPVYQTIKEEGPDHNKTFTVGIYSLNKFLAAGQGKSKQEAEEAAARSALEKLANKN